MRCDSIPLDPARSVPSCRLLCRPPEEKATSRVQPGHRPYARLRQRLEDAEVSRYFLAKPRACGEPVALNRLRRHAQDVCRLLQRESAEESMLHNLAAARIDPLESRQRVIQH